MLEVSTMSADQDSVSAGRRSAEMDSIGEREVTPSGAKLAAEKLDSAKGTGFSPYLSSAESTWALAPEGGFPASGFFEGATSPTSTPPRNRATSSKGRWVA